MESPPPISFGAAREPEALGGPTGKDPVASPRRVMPRDGAASAPLSQERTLPTATSAPVLLLFDIDGTLMDGAGSGRLAMDQAFERVFGVHAAGQGVETAGRTDLDIFSAMATKAQVQLNSATLGRLQQEYLKALPQTLTARAALLLPGAGELVRALAQDPRCRLALGTGNIAAGAHIKMAHFGLDGYFPVGGYGDDSEHRPTVIATALREACVHYHEEFDARRAVVIGDSPRDVQAARTNGMRVMAVGTARQGPGPVAEAKPDVLFPDMTDRARITAWLLD